jgi:hypothetical protein
MRPGQQNKRGRGRNSGGGGGGGNSGNFNRKGANPLTRTYDSSGPDVKIRGTAQHIAEKYTTLARDAQSAGDRVMAENYLQHAEHYNRIIAAAQAQMQERFQRDDRDDREDRDERDDRSEYNDRSDDMDDMDEPSVGAHVAQPQQQQRQQPRPQSQPQQQQPQRPQAQPRPRREAEIAGSGPQPVLEEMPAEAVVAAAESAADGSGERLPRRRNAAGDRKSTRLNSSHRLTSRMPSSA